ncbi:TPA: site-specific DNA-methyltransferase, partial [Listeria monocytogenes]|nr:site-specific DNA-methyltransferase [Listeria monocytogenes]
IDQILADRIKDENSKTKYKLDENGEPLIGKEKKGVPLSDVWNIPYLNPKAKERTGYPTQKPVLLLEQIIKLTTEENDIILDPFCGSGTTLVASKILKRRYIGIDQSKDAIKLAEERLKNVVKTESNLLKKGESSYKTKTDLELNILQSLDATVVQRNKGIDGFLKNYHNGFPVPIKIQKENEDLYSSLNFLQSAMRRKKSNLAILVQTHENNLNLMFTDIPNNILLIQKYDLLVNQWLLNYK